MGKRGTGALCGCIDLRDLFGRFRVFLLIAGLQGCAVAPWDATGPDESAPYTDAELVAVLEKSAIQAQALESGVLVRLDDLSFETGSADLSARARKTLRRLGAIVREPRAVGRSLLIEGHTDSSGSESYNLELSRQRADAVARELIFNQVRSERISIEAIGESRPLAPDTLADGRVDPDAAQKNRRVEVILQP